MRIDLEPDGGGVLIEGDSDELESLAEALEEACEHGDAAGTLLCAEGVETVRIRRLA